MFFPSTLVSVLMISFSQKKKKKQIKNNCLMQGITDFRTILNLEFVTSLNYTRLRFDYIKENYKDFENNGASRYLKILHKFFFLTPLTFPGQPPTGRAVRGEGILNTSVAYYLPYGALIQDPNPEEECLQAQVEVTELLMLSLANNAAVPLPLCQWSRIFPLPKSCYLS